VLRLQKKKKVLGFGIFRLRFTKAQNKEERKKLGTQQKVGTQNMIHTKSEYSSIPPLLQFNMVSLPILLCSDSEHGRTR